MTSSVQSTHTNDFISVKYETLATIQDSLAQDPVIQDLAKLIFPSNFEHANAGEEDLIQVPCSFLRNNAAALVSKKVEHRLMLTYLIRHKEQEFSHYLISHLGQDYLLLNLKGALGDTALHTAARYEAYETAQHLIANNANINSTNDKCSAPLHCAVTYPQPSMIQLLVSNNANTDAQNKYGYSPAIKAKLLRTCKQNSLPLEGPFRELYYRLILATIFGLTGKSHYSSTDQNIAPIQLEGCFPQYFSHLLSKKIKNEQASHYITAHTLDQMTDSFKFNIDIKKESSQTILERLMLGKAVTMDMGYQGHSIKLLIHPEYTENRISHFRLAICNRGSLSKKPIEFWTIEATDLTANSLKKLTTTNSFNREQRIQYFDKIWKKMGCYQTQNDRFLETQCSLGKQKSPNCSWVSSITVIWAFLALQNEGHRHLKEKTDTGYKNLVARIEDQVVSKYVHKHLHGNLQNCQIDEYIVKKIHDFYRRSNERSMARLCNNLLEQKAYSNTRPKTHTGNKPYAYRPY